MDMQDQFKIMIFQRRYWTSDVGTVDQLVLNLNNSTLQQILHTTPYTAGG